MNGFCCLRGHICFCSWFWCVSVRPPCPLLQFQCDLLFFTMKIILQWKDWILPFEILTHWSSFWPQNCVCGRNFFTVLWRKLEKLHTLIYVYILQINLRVKNILKFWTHIGFCLFVCFSLSKIAFIKKACMTELISPHISDHSPPKGHGKQLLVYAAAIIILVIAIACVYDYSKTSFSALHPYGGLYLCLLLTTMLLSNPIIFLVFKSCFSHKIDFVCEIIQCTSLV